MIIICRVLLDGYSRGLNCCRWSKSGGRSAIRCEVCSLANTAHGNGHKEPNRPSCDDLIARSIPRCERNFVPDRLCWIAWRRLDLVWLGGLGGGVTSVPDPARLGLFGQLGASIAGCGRHPDVCKGGQMINRWVEVRSHACCRASIVDFRSASSIRCWLLAYL